jgi:hypothetical protein
MPVSEQRRKKCIAYSLAYKARKKAAGLCHVCTESAVPGNLRCQKHILALKARARRRKEEVFVF